MTERRNNQRSTTFQGRAHEAEALTHHVIASRRRGNLINIIMKLKKPSTLKRLESSQRGIGLVELIIAIAITGIIGAAATMALHQVLTVPTISNNQNTAINQVRNAVHWISRDVQMAQSVNATGSLDPFLILGWTDWEGHVHEATYMLEDVSKELRRNYDGAQMLIAQYIDTDKSNCQWDGKVLTVTITATVGGKTETRTFKVKPRPD